jgi:hypothetical protein
MGSIRYTGEVITGQGEMGDRVDTTARVCYRPAFNGRAGDARLSFVLVALLGPD